MPDCTRRPPSWNTTSCSARTTGTTPSAVRIAPFPLAARPLGSSKKKPLWSGMWNSTQWRTPGTRRLGVGTP